MTNSCLLFIAVLQSLFSCLKKAQSDPKVVAIVITGANGKFTGGFDISQFQKQEGGAAISEMVSRSFLELVETGPKPTVAALSAIALGGGCELAVACNARVATPGAALS
jgi:enoyl-CoA hydratase/3-hydroxyacyl-CoA dehydrogenase